MRPLIAKEFQNAIEINRLALAQIIAALGAMVGFGFDTIPDRISKALRSKILMVLLPAESAARRLILVWMTRFGQANPLQQLHAPDALNINDRSKRFRAAASAPAHPFQLFDKHKRFDDPTKRKFTRNPPHIRFFHIEEQVFKPPEKTRRFENGVPAIHIVRRIRALQEALADLPAQASRMAKAIAWRKRNTARLSMFTPLMPLRPGTPPGYRKRHIHEVDQVLGQCLWLVWEAQAP